MTCIDYVGPVQPRNLRKGCFECPSQPLLDKALQNRLVNDGHAMVINSKGLDFG